MQWDITDTVEFLSTLSLRRATTADIASFAGLCNFYPRSPCGERRDSVDIKVNARDISIHALLAESDGEHIRNGQP